jgi:rubrerythrin
LVSIKLRRFIIGTTKPITFATLYLLQNHFRRMEKMKDRKLPGWMSENEYVCPRCGNSERGNVTPERVTACSYCAMSAAQFVEGHPEQYGLKKEDAKPRKFKQLGEKPLCGRCHKPFTKTSNRQENCPACRKYARAERSRKLAQEKSAAGP